MRLLATAALAALISFAEAAEYPDSERWAYTVGGFALEDEIIGPRPDHIVATGSSSMRFWDHRIHEDFAPLPIISRGFGGSNMNDVLRWLDQLVLRHEPRAVIIYEGDNDIAQGVPNEVILKTFTEVITKIKRFESTRIYLLSIKPSISRTEMWPQMVKMNKSIQHLAEQNEGVFYIDVATPMLSADGSIREDLFVSDMLHMNQAGYDLWRDVVVPFVKATEAAHMAE